MRLAYGTCHFPAFFLFGRISDLAFRQHRVRPPPAPPSSCHHAKYQTASSPFNCSSSSSSDCHLSKLGAEKPLPPPFPAVHILTKISHGFRIISRCKTPARHSTRSTNYYTYTIGLAFVFGATAAILIWPLNFQGCFFACFEEAPSPSRMF